MLLRLISALVGRRSEKTAPEAAPGVPSYRSPVSGSVVLPDGSARPALRVDAADAAAISVESSQQVRSAALYQTHLLPHVSPDALFELHRRYGRMLEAEVAGFALPLRPHADPRRRLRIGYVSPNFSHHSVSYFIEPVLAEHDRTAFEIYGYHTGAQCDATTAHIESCVDVWRQVHELTDEALTRLIADDGIDVAIDLAGHTLFGRPGVFARRAAPVQITWLGYPDTTGLTAVDYRITDAIADPAPDADARHTERLLRLSRAFVCYRPPADAPPVARREGDDGGVVFCSFNTVQKVNESVIALWSRVLQAVPGSRLLIKGGEVLAQAAVAERLRNAFSARGIDPDRLETCGWIEERTEHLALYGEADIALDTFPYNGTTTTCEALWMGVPVVTLAGEAHMSRVGATLLRACGLGDFVADTADDYVRIAAALARDRVRRRELRAELRRMLSASALLDHTGFTRELEGAIREAWVQWCARHER